MGRLSCLPLSAQSAVAAMPMPVRNERRLITLCQRIARSSAVVWTEWSFIVVPLPLVMVLSEDVVGSYAWLGLPIASFTRSAFSIEE
jgi:hypothetical protein